jgi:two-component system CheB/CheR fusion protein
LIKSDIGRPFTDLVTDLVYPDLASDALEVLNTLVFIQKQIPTCDGRWFSIRIMPYRTFDDRIDGLVITFINITDLKQVEVKLSETEKLSRLFINLYSDVIIHCSTELKILEFNQEAEIFFGKKRKDVLNQDFIRLLVPEKEQKLVLIELNKLLDNPQDVRFSMEVNVRESETQMIDLSVYVQTDYQNKAISMTLYTKITSHE